ncbi:MAG: thioredoxin family protein [Prevotellaceae bacterium]|jgi:thiol:disulfide interchange protein DsbD|nr:thioredoxin family protein [Prevotellaceae bacterium]
MKRIVYFSLFLFFSASVSAQIFEPVKWQFSTKQIDSQTVELVFTAAMDKGWHLYSMNMPEDELAPLPTKFVFEEKTGANFTGNVVGKSKLIEEYDKIFEMTVGFYSNSAVFSQKIKFNPEKGYKIAGYIDFQTCNDAACIKGYKEFVFEQKGKKNVDISEKIENSTEKNDTSTAVETVSTDTLKEKLSDIFSPVIEQVSEYNKIMGNTAASSSTSLWWIFLIGLGCGLIALITPCVWPVIPMTVSFFLKRSENKAKARKDAVLYGLSIILIYVALSFIITLLFGGNALNALSTNAIFNVFLFLLLIVFAISFFGAFEITLPASWSSKLDAKASDTTGFVSIFFMAFVLVIVSFSCTGPIIGGMIINIANGEFLVPIVVMLGFSIALAIPFGFFAFFPTLLKSLPKSGGWLNTVKVVLAFIELAFALKFLSVADLAYGWHILDREVFIVLWVVIFALLGVYLLGKIRFPHDDEENHVSIPKFFLAMISLAFAIYMLPGLWGAPLKAVSAFAPPMNTQDFSLYKNHLEAQFNDYELGMAAAKMQKKPVVVDFSGFGCVNCRKMEASEWTRDNVRERLSKDYILISLMVDDKTALPEAIEINDNGSKRKLRTLGDKYSHLQQHKFGYNAQPYYVILNENGEPLAGSFTYEDLKKGKDFLDFLNFGLKNYKNN